MCLPDRNEFWFIYHFLDWWRLSILFGKSRHWTRSHEWRCSPKNNRPSKCRNLSNHGMGCRRVQSWCLHLVAKNIRKDFWPCCSTICLWARLYCRLSCSNLQVSRFFNSFPFFSKSQWQGLSQIFELMGCQSQSL